MCTVSIIPLEPPMLGDGLRAGCEMRGGFRLVANRDESLRRSPGLAPRLRQFAGGVEAAWPTDSTGDGEGTWVGVSELGVALAILNVYPMPKEIERVPPDVLSRGTVIPGLLDAPTASVAAARLGDMDLGRFRGFRLIAVDRERVIESRWHRGELVVAERALEVCCFSSHGHGDHRAGPRLALFRRWFDQREATAQEQDAYHRHVWLACPEISVKMSRMESRTVSITTVTVPASCDDAIGMDYEDDSGVASVMLEGAGAGASA